MILSALLAVAALHATPLPVLAPQNTSPATAESLEILRRILVDSLDGAFEDEDGGKNQVTMRATRGFYASDLATTLWVGNQTVQHSRAFHLPSAGAFFSIDASLPTVAKASARPKEDESEKPTDDEWERASREVRGDQAGEGQLFRRLKFATPVEAEIDPKAIERVVDVTLRALSRHAARVEGLSSRDTITVALRLGGRSRSMLQHFGEAPDAHEYGFGPDGERDVRRDVQRDVERDGVERGDRLDEPLGETDDGTQTFSAYVLATGQSVREQNLVLRIAVGDLASETSADRLRERAQINLY